MKGTVAPPSSSSMTLFTFWGANPSSFDIIFVSIILSDFIAKIIQNGVKIVKKASINLNFTK
jgi:hypothetical protein